MLTVTFYIYICLDLFPYSLIKLSLSDTCITKSCIFRAFFLWPDKFFYDICLGIIYSSVLIKFTFHFIGLQEG